MTCTSCGSADAVAARDGAVLCTTCRERLEWARIIDIVQRGIRIEADVSFDETEPAGLGADPFA